MVIPGSGRIAAVRVWCEDGRFLSVGAVEIFNVRALHDHAPFDEEPFNWIPECDVLEEDEIARRIHRRPNRNSDDYAVGIDEESYLFLGCPMGNGRLSMCPQLFEWLVLQLSMQTPK